MTPLLSVQHLSITHDGNGHASPSDVSFTVAPGEVVLLLGPSGSGKSTLALALNGLIPHDIPATVGGSVQVAGLDAATATPAQLSPHVSMVFQDPDAQLITGTVLDEVAFGPENLLLPVPEVLQRVEWALRRVHLWDRRYDNPDTLSGGGRQRLAIACALAIGAPVMVLDEPTANLDPAGVEEVYAVLAEIVRERDCAIVLVEHNLDEAIGFATRVVVLDTSGTVAYDGPAKEIVRTHGAELAELGVWLPTATLAGLRLREAGHQLPQLPVTPAELAAALPAAVASPAAIAPTSAADMILHVRDLRVVRDGKAVLDNVSLDIARGSFTAIIGGNGAGKTTLVQAIAGVVRPPKGTVTVDGVDPARVNGKKLSQHVGFVFQNPEHQLIAPTVYDELAVCLRGERLAEEVEAKRVDAVLERFGLLERRGAHPFLLSGGQKRRLSVATALMSAAPVIILDEPTFGQDRARAHELISLLRELNQDGTTVIVVTHDMQLVADEATHVIALNDGRVEASGPVRDVFADVATIRGVGLRLPAITRAVRKVPGYQGAWSMQDLTHIAGQA